MQIEHLDKETTDATVRNLDALYQLFPSCFTEAQDAVSGDMHRVVDWGKLRELLGEYVESDEPEKYDFTWVGKRAAQREAAAPCRKTLRPCKEESVDWDTTQNLYIEGDNLEVLKLLQNSYMGKVKMIYIDPPYNTGNDFVYHDDFAQSAEEYDEHNLDDEGNRYRKNTDSNGRFHSDWCSMIYTRLMVARSLLTEDGVIFISLNDIEVSNARKICDEIFGISNFVADLIWANKEGGGSSDSKLFRIKNEHILCYSREIESLNIKGVPISNAERYKGKDEYYKERGPYYLQKLGMGSIQYSASLDYPIETPDGTFVNPAENNKGKRACWRWSKEKYLLNKERGFVEIKRDSAGVWTVYTKQYMNCDNDGNPIERSQRPMGIIDEFSSTQASKLLDTMGIPFDYSKPIELIGYLVDRICNEDFIAIDFFSGSATTAHAVMQLNAEDGGNRKFIMVQLPEETAEDSEAYKAGYKNICEIGKERIRRAGKKIKAEHAEAKDLDIGFRVLKCDESNYKPVAFAPKDYTQESLDMFLDNIKEERTGLDLLFDCMMRWGLELSLPYDTQKVDGCTIYNVDDGNLVACFDGVVTGAVIDAIAETHPLRVVFRDSSFTEAAQKMNLFVLFKQKCGWTDQEVQNNVRVI